MLDDSAMQALTLANLDAGRPLRVALLTNPGSGRNRQGGGKIEDILARHPETIRETARTPAEVVTALQRQARHEPELLIINGGDGTVAAVFTALFNERPFQRLPLLALLAGGTTNMTAADAGMKGPAPRALERLLHWAHAVDPTVAAAQRRVLRVQPADDVAPLYGMFFGAGAIIKGIEYFHQKVLRRGLRDGLGPGLSMLRILYALSRGDHRYVSPVSLKVATAPALEQEQVEREYFILLASTLERLFLGLRPYWGEQNGGLYYSAIGASPRRPLRAIPPLFWGRAGRHATPANGYWSRKIDELILELEGTFTIDGELYPASPARGPVRISHTIPLTFLRF